MPVRDASPGPARGASSTRASSTSADTAASKRAAGGLQESIDNSLLIVAQRKHLQSLLGSRATAGATPASGKETTSSLPAALRSGIERLSGCALDGVKVHYDSDKPSQLQALAYTQGADIHLGPGQERHLPHEAWHVVQQ